MKSRAETRQNNYSLPPIVKPPYRGRLGFERIRDAVARHSVVAIEVRHDEIASLAYKHWLSRDQARRTEQKGHRLKQEVAESVEPTD